MVSTRRRRAPRLSPGDRKRHVLRVVGDLMTRRGVDAIQMGDVATAAGVSRQHLYTFFPSRQALIKGVLDDFADALAYEFGRRAMHRLPVGLDDATRVFVEAVCDTIEAKGVGPWHLLDSNGPDPEVGRLGQDILQSLMRPWHAHIAAETGVGAADAAIVARMLVAAGRAVLDLWCTGEISREEAVRHASRGVSALLSMRPKAARKRRVR